MPGAVSSTRQAFPGNPKFTDRDVPDLKDKIIIVTGSNTGVGKEIAQILYSKNAKVYMMARSEEKTKKAIASIKTALPTSSGELVFLRLDLADLPSIKTSAQEFLRREQELHVLFNNAGVAYPGQGTRTDQGYELQLGVNCIGTFALTKHLTPVLVSTAKTSLPDTVRVVWTSSSAAEALSPKDFVENLPEVEKKGSFNQYCISKLGNYLHATEFAARHKKDGVLCMPLNPGNLDSELWRTQGPLMSFLLRKTVLHPPVYGAYTNLFAGVSPEITLEKSGSYVAPWGKLWQVSDDMIKASKTKVEGGTEIAKSFWEWTDVQVRPYL
ncbi:hypothetical protein BJ170DRAFT_674699 [Xylariales sp. AK1849]|nr:hypothetical protein BJ170DRAFT_674699 [Xylariales sp. AK1849]